MASAMGSVVTTLRVLEAVSEAQPVGVSELSRTLGLPKTTVQRSLESLRAAGWLRQDDRSLWVLTLKTAIVGQRASGEFGIRDLAYPTMLSLRHETDESVRLWIPEGDDMVLVTTLESSRAVRAVSYIGAAVPMHASAAGKAVLAALGADELEQRLALPLPAYTPHTLTDPDALRAHLREIRRRGYAVSNNERYAEVGAIAAAVTAPFGRPIAALAIALPSQRLTAAIVKSRGPLVRDAAGDLSEKIGATQAS